MRKLVMTLAASVALLAGCVTINVYFPAAAAQKAADQIISNVIGPASENAPEQQPPASGGSSGGGQNDPDAIPLAVRVLDALVPVAQAAEPDLDVRTPEIEAIQGRMKARFHGELKPLLDSGAVGLTRDGGVAIRDASQLPLAQRASAKQTVADENADRTALYRAIATANGNSSWAGDLRKKFAERWIALAHAGWYYQNAAGSWVRK